MLKRIIRLLFTFVGVTIGFSLYFFILESIAEYGIVLHPILKWGGLSFFVILFGAAFEVLTPRLVKMGQKIISGIEKESQQVSVFEMGVGLLGVIIGLIISYFLSGFTARIPYVGTAITIVMYMFFIFLGYTLSTRRKDEISSLITNYRLTQPKEKQSKKTSKGTPKVLDTSVIIDGRILDISATGFLEGQLIVPNFVLEELRHIADSSEDLKRVKGRRGLDILNSMQSDLKLDIEISDVDFPEILEVDMKLLKLAQNIGGKVLTNDYNLNKVAQFQGVEVLNINELANAVKTVLIPGEEMVVTIIKEGKEHNQGVAYLDDGTMIVVENAKKLIGETLTVVVTTMLQTAAGRMIFARQK